MKRRPHSRSASLEHELKTLQAKNTELTRLLRSLDEARSTLADHYDFAPIGFVTLDEKGCVREINLTTARILCRERNHLMGMPFLPHVQKSDCEVFLAHLRQCRKSRGKVISDMSLRTGRTGTVPVEMRSVPVIDPHSGATVYRTAITDITERLRARDALRRSEERYRAVVELSPDGVFIQRDGRVILVNSAGVRLVGAQNADDIIGRRLLDLMRPDFQKPRFAALLDPKRYEKEPDGLEAKLVRNGGMTIDIEIAARRLDNRDDSAVLVIARDVTRRKDAERQVVAISEREQARFGQDLHDGLCQTLAGAACLAESLHHRLRKIDARLATDAEEIASIVRNSTHEARDMAYGLFPVRMEGNGLTSALQELATDVSRRAHIHCAFECDAAFVGGDGAVATNIYRIAQEAIANAVKHGGAKLIVIRLAVNNGTTTLMLEDDGRGFPSKPKRTGMGLHTMRYRASMIGGLLDIRRSGARGTLVTCSFPTQKLSRFK